MPKSTVSSSLLLPYAFMMGGKWGLGGAGDAKGVGFFDAVWTGGVAMPSLGEGGTGDRAAGVGKGDLFLIERCVVDGAGVSS